MFESNYRQLGLIGNMGRQHQEVPKFDEEAIRRRVRAQMPKIAPVSPVAFNPIQGTQGVSPTTGNSNEPLAALMRAIGGKESNNNYRAVNRDSGALGKYQIMPMNIRGTRSGWDYEALGRDITEQEFLNNPSLQEQITQNKMGQYLSKYGPGGAAAAWYGGPGAVKRMGSTQRYDGGRYPSISEYIADILKRL